MRILIVDDSPVMRSMLKRLLVAMGIKEVTEAGDGYQALQLIATSIFDLILLDWRMPVLPGLDTLKQLKAMPDLCAIPVVMVASESQKQNIVEAIQAGAADYIIKPFDEKILREKLKPFMLKTTA